MGYRGRLIPSLTPTTAGTGSEVGRAGVITDETTHTKKVIFHPLMMPKVTICDPELTVGMPPMITAGTGMDALAHCLEAYCGPFYHPLADGIAVEGMRLVKDNLLNAYRNASDIEARTHMMSAAAMGATAFQKALGAIHSLSHPVGSLYDTHHGLTNAVFMPYVLVFNRGAIESKIERLAAWVLCEPEVVEIGARRSPAETVTHAVYPVAAEQKFDLLMALLERTNFDSALIFSRTKHGADRIASQLKQARHSVAVLHSNRTQRERVEALEGFKSGKYEVMVATDIAARGIDIAGVSHVINYDVPEHPEDYVHRIGRTGRAQNVGDAFTLMNGQELPSLQAIERFIGQKIPRLKLDSFPYIYTVLFEPESASGSKRAIGGGRTHRGYSFGRRRR